MSTKENTNSAIQINALKEVYAAINRNDVPGVLKFFDPHIKRIEPEGFPSSGTYHGHSEVEAHFSQALNTWAEGSCGPEDFIVNGDKVVVYVHVKVRLKDKVEWVEGHIADGFIFRDGKVVEMRTFIERKEALKWVKL